MDFNAIFDPYLLDRENLYRIFAYIIIIWWFKLDVLCGLLYIILVFMFDVSILNASFTFVIGWYVKLIIGTKFSHLNKLPGKQLYNPIFGSQPIFKSRQIYKDFGEDYKNYGTIYRHYDYFSVPWVNVSDPKLVNYVLVTNAKNYTRGSVGLVSSVFWILGKSSLLTMCGKNHKKHKSIINRAIKNEGATKITDITVECANRLIIHWNKLMLDEKRADINIDIHKYMNNISVNIIGLFVLGIDFDCIRNKCYIAKEILKLTEVQRWTTLSIIVPLFSMINPYLSRIFNTQRFVSGAYGMRKYLKNFINTKSKMVTNNSVCIADFLIGLNEERLSNEEIEDELFTLLPAGADSTSLGLTYTLYSLSKYPDWQNKCREEIERLMNDCGEEFAVDKVRQLKIVRGVINESLRLYTPGPLVTRQSIEGDYLNGYYIPPRTNLQILLCQMHRLPDYWLDPEKFNPERFLNYDKQNSFFDAYAPFSDGVHKCVGYSLAVSEITVIISMLLHKFSFELVSPITDLEFTQGATLKPKSKITLKVLEI